MFGIGKKVEIEIPDGRGGTKRVKVSRKQFDHWVAEGKLKPVESFTAHISDPIHGTYTEIWTVGGTILQETYDRFKDERGDVYAMVVYKAGNPEMSLLKKNVWDQLQIQLIQIEKANNAARDDVLRWLHRK